MAALTSPPFIVLFACSWIVGLCQGTQEVKVTAGEDATLQCRSHGGAAITVIRWTRADLKLDDGYVFFFRDNRSRENDQHESYRGRVELRDPEMKDGDASVILKNVSINDTGTYECWVREKNETGKGTLNSIVNMTVTEPGHTDGHEEENVGLKVGLSVGGILLFLLLLCAGGVVMFKKYRRPTEKEQSAANEAKIQKLQ